MKPRKKLLKKVLGGLLSASMLIGLVACGSDGGESTNTTSSGGQKQDEEEVVELTYYGSDSTVIPGEQDNEVAKYIEEKLNVRLNVVSLTEEQLVAGMASGDLPDIFQIGGGYQIEDFIEANLILELDDLVEEYGPNIKENGSKMLDFMREYKSNGTDKLYGLTTSLIVNNPEGDTPASNYSVGFLVRWDYYKELGYPEIHNEDEFLEMLKQMQEAHPTTEDGKPVYGISGFSDWGLWSYTVPYIFSHGWMNGDYYFIDPEGQIQSYLEEDGLFKKSMQFLYKANKMGLCDPEMFSQKNSDFMGKNANLQYLCVPSNWWNNDAILRQQELGIEDTGFYQIPGAFPSVYSTYYMAQGLADRPTVISASCEYPEAAMKLLDFLYSYEGARLLFNGVEGVNWNVVDGKKTLTEETLTGISEGGTEYQQKTGIGLYPNMTGLAANSKDADGDYINLALSDDVLASATSEGDKRFSEHYGVEYPAQAYQKAAEEGKTEITIYDYSFTGFMSALDSDASMISTQCTNYYLPWVSRLVNAQSDEEFEQIWETGVEELNAMGYDDIYKIAEEDAAAARESAKIFE